MANYEYPRIKEQVHGKELSILGVAHTERFFHRHKSFFEEFVENNDAVVLEQVLGGDFWEDKSFFNKVGELARRQGKRVYQVDPVRWSHLIFDAGGLITSGFLIGKGIKSLDKDFSRRGALKFLAQSAIGTSLFLGSLFGKWATFSLSPAIVMSYGFDDQIEYGSTDYRNIVIADGLDKLCRTVEDVERIGSIHGAAHYETVHEYLISPAKRLKRLAYFPHDLLGNTAIREYTPVNDGWVLSRNF